MSARARARTVRAHPSNILAEIERLTDRDERVLRLVAEHEVLSTEQLAGLCFDRPADALPRLNYLATRALLVKFEHPGTHPAALPGDEFNDTGPAGLRPAAQPAAWSDGRRWVWSLGQGGVYWAGVERVLSRPAWIEAWTRSFAPERRPHLRRRLALNDFFTALHHSSRTRPDVVLDQWWGPQTCTDASGGHVAPDAHGRWRHLGVTVPLWVYSDHVRDPFRTLITTVERHSARHGRTLAADVILLAMVDDNREMLLHRRWLAHAASSAALPRVATTAYRRLRGWPTDAIWWPIDPHIDIDAGSTGRARRLHQLAPPATTADSGAPSAVAHPAFRGVAAPVDGPS